VAHVLARESADDDVDAFDRVPVHAGDVAQVRDVRVSVREDPGGSGVDVRDPSHTDGPGA